jgi:prolipoprotein diacylglyceryltransferase
MQQVLFRVHIPFVDWSLPIFGYGVMLFVAFCVCLLVLAPWRARKAGVPIERVFDVAFWIFICGIIGARAVFMIQYQVPLDKWYEIWKGGLVFYGSAIGGVIGYGLAYAFVIRKYQVSSWKMADIAAPCIAAGLCIGRLGCFLNGCCYGNVACSECPAIHFPMSSPARQELVTLGYQTAGGFITEGETMPLVVRRVEPGSPAADSGLQAGDQILKVNGVDMEERESKARENPLTDYLTRDWPLGEKALQLKVKHKGGKEEDLPAFYPQTLGLHPTQLYETISMLLLFLVVLAYYPFRRRDGELIVIVMLVYAVHRFLDEILRNDTEYVAFHMTLSQLISILVFAAGLVTAWLVWRQPVQYERGGEAGGVPLPAAGSSAK